eukprot:TRINITY_DN2039_c1_g1_i4.p1 TRINITY_DN2039_c1_g1~~TRINITY_DN2039_c1_g1_i4.p1  ORF type:complete len:487 (-),score=102.47 TRINITY_DN2039_c1_g1_i4:43-1503(-)
MIVSLVRNKRILKNGRLINRRNTITESVALRMYAENKEDNNTEKPKNSIFKTLQNKQTDILRQVKNINILEKFKRTKSVDAKKDWDSKQEGGADAEPEEPKIEEIKIINIKIDRYEKENKSKKYTPEIASDAVKLEKKVEENEIKNEKDKNAVNDIVETTSKDESGKDSTQNEVAKKVIDDDKPFVHSFPPQSNWSLSLIVVILGSAIIYLYTYFSFRDIVMEELVTFLRYGGFEDHMGVYSKLRKYFIVDALGIRISEKLVQLGFIDALLDVLFRPRNNIDKENALRYLCYFTRNENNLGEIIDSGALPILRNYLTPHNINAIYAVANLSAHEEARKIILEDYVFMDNILYSLSYSLARGSIEDLYVQRALLKTLSNLSDNKLRIPQLMEYEDRLQNILLNHRYYMDPFIVLHKFHTILNLVAYPYVNEITGNQAFPELFKAKASGIIQKPTRSVVETQLIINTGLTGIIASIMVPIFNRVSHNS